MSALPNDDTIEIPDQLWAQIASETPVPSWAISPPDVASHLNSTRDVKLITYDELLEKLEILIQNLESLD